MSVELDEVYGFLAQHEPFSTLPEDILRALPVQMGITYVRRGQAVVEVGQPNDTLYVIRSGAVDIVSEDNLLLDRREAGLNFGYSTLVGERESAYLMQAVEDSILLLLPREAFLELLEQFPDMGRLFQTASRRVRAAAEEVRDVGATDVLRTPLREIFAGRGPVTRGKDVSIAEAARTMGEEGISSLIITDGQAVTGIITDADMRSRVVAAGVDTSRPVADVMTSPVRTIAPNALVFEAMLTMSGLGIHHLPVAGQGQIVGVVTATDIMRLLQADPIYLAADVAQASLEELEGAYRDAVRVAVRFFERGASAAEAQRLLTSIADGVAKRLGTLAVEKLGPPPVPFAFVAVGSQARGEMGPASDQDNALVLADSFDAERHGEYYAEFSVFVCEGLARAGQALCPGDMMASSPQWRMTESEWGRTFHGWGTAPKPDALLHAQVFFDFRAVFGFGEGWEDMAARVRSGALASAHGSRRLHTHLAALATFREPPVGFFRGFVLERSGDYAHTLDIKRGGTAAVVQMARLYAIAAGVDEVDTIARLGGAAGGPVSAKGAANLLDAYEYLANLAMRHQAKQVRAGDAPNYHIDPKQLPERDRAALRDAFGVIKSLQNALSTAYPTRAV
ncbi:DUF294 nucleotidyltransferase-like domain-containing protein [Corynebacterium afermentans]|uniref:DUF294 nucleotidyltransferase-like domain-containing protein n=1 Tax=Corynebacterium afermentans TaxID=38286 RepID=UPI0025743F8C|nr:DUF294 nucleotidyltransferase-like domain-containing protein [Corynebacterium afermentans]MCG7272755.1 DUF294 nucleotidyltransferase-like domain-containing protein [Corynebacterium afermentans]